MKIDIKLDITMCQANTKTSWSIKIDNLFANPEKEVDSGDFSSNNQIGYFNILEVSISFTLQQWQVDDINNFVWIFSI